MDFNASFADLLKIKADTLVLLTESSLGDTGKQLDGALSGQLSELIKSGDFKGKPGECLRVHLSGGPFRRLLLATCGKASEPQSQIRAIQGVAQELARTHTSKAVWIGDESAADVFWHAQLVARSIEEACYRYQHRKKEAHNLKSVIFHVSDRAQANEASRGLAWGAAVGRGMNAARELGNTPANLCTPGVLASRAQQMAKGKAKISVRVLGETDMKALKMGSLLSVTAGTEQPAKMIVFQYKGAAASNKPVVLVGKAVTFDAGGISLKPAAAMDEMKYDMCGGASVFGVMQALLETELPINVVGLVPAVENLPSGRATKPGDVVTSMSGQTIEVLNTDAEGRLILCDALTYAARFKPDTVIDIATLTGACVMALSKFASGVMGNNQDLVNQLLECGTRSGDRVWQFPLWDDYDKLLKSNFADMANIGGREAGAITAGCFLARFTRDYTWAHLDIAGTAWVTAPTKGATGRPVPLLMEYLRQKAG